MTDIQVKFWANQEIMRSNQAQEALTRRDLSERERHNLVSEKISAVLAAASQTQAAAAMRQAEVAQQMADLQARRVAIEERLESLNAAKLTAESVYTRSKTRSEYYNMLLTQQKTKESAAQASYLEAETAQSKSDAKLAFERAKTEAITRSQKLTETITSWATLPASIIDSYGRAAQSSADGLAGWVMPRTKKGGSRYGY